MTSPPAKAATGIQKPPTVAMAFVSEPTTTGLSKPKINPTDPPAISATGIRASIMDANGSKGCKSEVGPSETTISQSGSLGGLAVGLLKRLRRQRCISDRMASKSH